MFVSILHVKFSALLYCYVSFDAVNIEMFFFFLLNFPNTLTTCGRKKTFQEIENISGNVSLLCKMCELYVFVYCSPCEDFTPDSRDSSNMRGKQAFCE